MSSSRAVGIDLGTTYSAVSYLDDRGRTAMVRGAGGDILTPSVVFFCDEETVVGKEARKYLTLWPDAVAQCAKRDMGLPFYSQPIRGRQLPPEVIQACVLRQLKDDATTALGANFKCVITVPAYFDEVRRRATAQAGEMAGLDVLDIVNEPTAAALSFGEILGYLSPAGEPREALTVLVYDLGGGTFDVTVIELAPGDITTLATDGDVRLGGRDWDEALVNWVAERFRAETGADPWQDKVALGELFLAVEEAKRTLSVRGKTSVPVRHAGHVKDISISLEQFEELTEPLLERTSLTTRQVIAAAGVTWDSIDRVLLVGGASRMPMVSRMLEGLSGKKPDHSVHPDEAVARGAAIFAGYLLAKSPRDENVDVFAESVDFQEIKGEDAGAIEPAGDEARTGSHGLSSAARLAAEQLDKIYQSAKPPAPVAPKPVKSRSVATTTADKPKDKRTAPAARPTVGPTFSVTDVNSHSLGIEGLNRKIDRKENVVLIERNTRLPARITHHFVTKEAGQRSIVVQVLEGENRDPRQCSRIGRAVMRDLPENLPRGWPIEVVYEYGTNGRLSVYARLPRTQSKVTVEFEHEEGMPGERVRRWRRVIEGNPGFDTFESMLEDIMDEREVERKSSLDARSIRQPDSPTQPPTTVEPDLRTLAVSSSSADAVAAMSQSSGVAGDARYDLQGDIPRAEPVAVFRRRNWGITILGHILAAVAGLLIGYYVLAWFTPRGNFLELPLPWMPPIEDVRGENGTSMRLGGS